MVAGVLIGLPALRLRGLYLALITLMLAGGITVVLATVNFPNGGHGFLGYNGSLLHIPPIRRPSIAASDPAYYRYSVIVAIVMFALVLAHIKTKPGRAWAAIRQSEAAALAAGINITLYKLWAFALASFITGVAGGVLAGAIHYLYSINFPDPGLDHAAGRGADGRRVQPVGRGDRRVALPVPARPAQQLGRLGRLADHLVRHRCAPGADDRAGRAGRPGAQGPGPAAPSAGPPPPPQAGRDGA